ncbi:MAG: 30S ribosomal protein S8 [Rickettsia sp.]|nr:30S ribosomal protein S8 [Rickettsia sp.]
MSMSDNIADMLTRIRNGQSVSLLSVHVDFSRLKLKILDILLKEGYIKDYMHDKSKNILNIKLKYTKNSSPVIKEISRVSKPSRRFYTSVNKIRNFYNGLGIQILSTSKGVLSHKDAKALNVGGEILCKVF